MKKINLLALLLSIVITSCSDSKVSFKVAQEPSDKIINELNGTDFSIVLSDMDIEDKNDTLTYNHKYHILKKIKDSIAVDSTDWVHVNEDFFVKYKEDLGMEIISNHGGKLSRIAQPVGYGWAIGNPKYGSWEEDKTDKTKRSWRPSGSSLLFAYWMLRRPSYRSTYNQSRAYTASGRTFYGNNSNGGSTFGTNSDYQKSKRSGFFSRTKSSSTWNSFKNKTGRSSSRYGNSSSTRSRGGGSGK